MTSLFIVVTDANGIYQRKTKRDGKQTKAFAAAAVLLTE